MGAFLYGISLQFKMDIRSRSLLVTCYLVPLLFFAVMGGIFTSIMPGSEKTLIQSMTVMGVSMGALIGVPPSLAEIYGTDVRKMYQANGAPLWYGLITLTVSAFIHLLIMSGIILAAAPVMFHAEVPSGLLLYFVKLSLFIIASLGIAGRAIGHRVWQSVEYYMANYPDVRAALRNGGDLATVNAAMHVAFEDQLVQKVMPKLRGIDTRGKFGKCLDEIQGLLNTGIGDKAFVLDEDFQLARDLGHGQFMWQSANYLNENDRLTAPTEIADEFENTSQEVINDNQAEVQTPPDWFRPGDEKRIDRWNKMSPERQQEIIESNKRQPKQ